MSALAIAGGVQVALAGLSYLESKSNADALRRQAQFEANQMEFNAELLGAYSADIEAQGRRDIVLREQQVRQMLGDQKAAFAAQGIDLSSEVVQNLSADELQTGIEDVQAIKNNTWKEVFGIEVQQADLRTKAMGARITGQSQARATLATGGLSALSQGVTGFSNIYRG